MATQTLSEAQDPISGMNKLRSPEDARAFLGLSLREMAVKITDTKSHDLHHVSRQFWSDVEHRKSELEIGQIRQVENVLAEALMQELAYDAMLSDVTRRFAVRIKVLRDGRWAVRVFTTCVKCGKVYNIARIDSKRCRRCIARRKRIA